MYELRTTYSASIEKAMQLYYGRLGEKDRRQYAAVEAIKLGHGGVTYISRILSIDRGTIIDGKKELLASTVDEPMAAGRQRRTGGGRKKKDRSTSASTIANGANRKPSGRQPDR